jgi:hypothetical protein
VPGSELTAVAAHSPDFDALNQLLNRGAKPEDIALTTTVLAWPQEGPTPQLTKPGCFHNNPSFRD